MASELTEEQTASLGSLSSVIATVEHLLAAGVTAAEMADHVAKFINPTAAKGLEMLIKVLQEAEKLLGKVG